MTLTASPAAVCMRVAQLLAPLETQAEHEVPLALQTDSVTETEDDSAPAAADT